MRDLWEKHGLLDRSQHAYRSGRGTENALLHQISGMEEAEETATDLLTSTWDQVHAFDCLGRNASRISLYRLGVPHECLTGLIGIDETGKTVIRTPKARRVWDLLMGSDLSTSYER
ncbi:MAG: hypothetical protein EBY29_16615, partial [Planctomycetes bacterium]|nr:hypothetical protein [Planctomycetota bacterium]